MVKDRDRDKEKRAAAYLKVLAYAFHHETEEEILERWMNNNLFGSILLGKDRKEAENADIQMGMFREKYLAGQCRKADLDQDYLKLFIGMGTPLVPPWGSYYMNERKLLFQDEAAAVKTYMENAGWTRESFFGIPADFIAYELEFVSWLLERGASETAVDFLKLYVIPWIDLWNQRIQLYAEHDFYPALGNLTVGACRALCSSEDIRDV